MSSLGGRPTCGKGRDMKNRVKGGRRALVTAALAAAIAAAAGLTSATAATGDNAFAVHNLVSDVPGLADHTDASLVNAWGLTSLPTSPWWVADNGTDVSTLYRADGSKVPLTVQVPSAPTGAASNSSGNFVVTDGTNSGAARFLFDTEQGKVLGWNPAVNGGVATLGADRSDVDAIYKGLAISSTEDTLYAADFHNARVDVFDSSFHLVMRPGAFVDPKLPGGYAPFGIANLGGRIFVSYAKQDADQEDEVAGQGLGFVDMYDQAGTFLQRVVNHGQLNAPWGLAMAPAGFGPFGGDLLVGNFGDGRINAYAPQASGTYERVDALRGDDNKPIEIDGLWAIVFGKGALVNNGPVDTLFFTAGPDDESHGLFGTIRAK
jgi:uncharacterized protein (TIGR03118 family)